MRSKASLATQIKNLVTESSSPTVVNEDSATALVKFTGLAIICLNQQPPRCEIGILRDGEHQLSITISEPYYTETGSVGHREVASYKQLPNDVLVEITATNPSVTGYQLHQPGNFNRLSTNDPNDFRWLVDMQGLHGSPLGLPNQERYPLTKLYIASGLLYTYELDQRLFFDKITTGADGVVAQPYGRVAKTMGAQIDGSEVTLTLKYGTRVENHVLQRIANHHYIIDIKNMNYGDSTYSDMPDYYLYTASPGNQVELRPGEAPGVAVATPRSNQVVQRQAAARVNPGVILGTTANPLGRPTPPQDPPANQVDFCHPVVFPFNTINLL